MRYAIAAIAILLASGCSTENVAPTQRQATARVDQLIQGTAAAISPSPRLELIPYSVPPSTCLDESQSQDKVIINRKYWLRGIPKSQNMAVSRQIRTYWETQGHRITGTGRGDSPNLSGLSQPDHYILALAWADGDNLYLAATSPCATPA